MLSVSVSVSVSVMIVIVEAQIKSDKARMHLTRWTSHSHDLPLLVRTVNLYTV